MDVIVLQLFLSLILFYIVKLIGSISYSLGYSSLSDIQQQDNSFSYNAVVRIFSPTVYIILVSILFYKLDLPRFINNIWLVSFYYSIFTILLIIFLGRWPIINKSKIIIYSALSVLSAYFIYTKYINLGLNHLLPEIENTTTELWFIVIMFFYKVLDTPSDDWGQSQKRLEKYVLNKYFGYKGKYISFLKKYDKRFQNIVFAIMILEDFYRPAHIRFFERILHRFGKAKTLGIMQVKTKRLISDEESIRLAISRLLPKYTHYMRITPSDRIYEHGIIDAVVQHYNYDDYSSKVGEIYQIINNN